MHRCQRIVFAVVGIARPLKIEERGAIDELMTSPPVSEAGHMVGKHPHDVLLPQMSKLDIQASFDKANVKRRVIANENLGILKDMRDFRRDLLRCGSVLHHVIADSVDVFRLRPFRKVVRSYVGIVEDRAGRSNNAQLQQLVIR